MPAHARLLATVPCHLPSDKSDWSEILDVSGGRMLTQRTDDELVVCALDESYRVRPRTEVRFPAPWPRRRGSWALAPDAGVAVFAGVHALQAVDAAGAVRWEVRHGCWEGTCAQMHQSYDEYAEHDDHRHPKSGSAGFSSDGRFVWAHVHGPLPEGELDRFVTEEWLVIDAEDGRVLARANTDTAAEGSFHIPHPTDPGQMGLSVLEGPDGAPVRWGRWNGRHLTVDHTEDDVIVLSTSPSGRRLMTVSGNQSILAVRSTYGDPGPEDGLELDGEAVIPRHPDSGPENDEPDRYWDWAGGFINETTVIGSTEECDAEWGDGRHWLIDTESTHPLAQVLYPAAVSTRPIPLGDGAWYTPSDSGAVLYVWTQHAL